ncbi:MAG: ABC transporter permease [Clostridia bacterium]|nr:ABC transporter permease [Clostridia bacterium]
MELLNRLTIKNLKLNKKRTIVTIIGIILATALITGVATLVSSFQKSIIEYEKRESGDYHYEFKNVPIEELKYIEKNRNIELTYITQDIGYSKLEESKNDYKPYLYLIGYSKEAMKKLNLSLLEGRLPENENEIVISKHIQTNGKVDLKIGDEITLDIGKRMRGEEELDQNNPYILEEDIKEHIVGENVTNNGKINNNTNIGDTDEDTNNEVEKFIPEKILTEITKKYKIVGIMERPNWTTESYKAPGYTVITLLENNIPGKNINVYTRYKDLDKQTATTAQIEQVDEKVIENLFVEDYEKLKYDFDVNSSLIRWENSQFSQGTLTMLYTVAVLVIAIIIVTSVFCIRNSFEISITEKTRQYGMLASIGATSKQIRKNVFYEGLILAIFGIPIGIISGLGAIFILLQVIKSILRDSLYGMDLIFATNWVAIMIAIILSGVTIYWSAKKSAKKASKISPIEAIRSNQDIKIKSKKIKSPKIVKKIFGIGGDIAYKNLKRNNKKYRTTVISIVVSVSIFVAMSSFMNYAFKTSGIYDKDYQDNIRLSVYDDNYEDVKESFKDMKEISKNSEVKSYSIIRTLAQTSEEMKNHYSKTFKEIYSEEKEIIEEDVTIEMIALGKQEYNKFIKELGLKYDNVKDKAILIDEQTEYVTINNKPSYQMYRIYDYKKGDTINFKADESGNGLSIEIAEITSTHPKGLENRYRLSGYLIVSDEYIEKYEQDIMPEIEMFIDARNANNFEVYMKNNYATSELNISNLEDSVRNEKAMWTVIAIFLYGFITVISLIGVTNIFNTITTNMELRQKEFANLKSIGMTKKEFNKMIRLESFFYGFKSLIIGIPIGLLLSYLIYKAFVNNINMEYILPTNGIIISIVAVVILIGGIMKYSLNKINKQNIIETIRKNNI